VKRYSMSPVNPECSLWVGAKPPEGDSIGKYFDVLVLSAMEIQDPGLYPGVKKILRVPLDDSGIPPTPKEILMACRAGITVADQLMKGKMVLSTCRLGLNRSVLVASLALRDLGWGAEKTIRAVRRARGREALSNRWFEKIIRIY
jgi:protein-tyrosine phosphatase